MWRWCLAQRSSTRAELVWIQITLPPALRISSAMRLMLPTISRAAGVSFGLPRRAEIVLHVDDHQRALLRGDVRVGEERRPSAQDALLDPIRKRVLLHAAGHAPPARPGGCSVNHCAMSGMCCSKAPGIGEIEHAGARRAAILEVVRHAVRHEDERALRGIEPLVADPEGHHALDDVEHVVLGMRMRARALRVRLEPPLGDRIALGGLGAVGLKSAAIRPMG